MHILTVIWDALLNCTIHWNVEVYIIIYPSPVNFGPPIKRWIVLFFFEKKQRLWSPLSPFILLGKELILYANLMVLHSRMIAASVMVASCLSGPRSTLRSKSSAAVPGKKRRDVRFQWTHCLFIPFSAVLLDMHVKPCMQAQHTGDVTKRRASVHLTPVHISWSVKFTCPWSVKDASAATLATGFRCFYFLEVNINIQVPYIFGLLGADLVTTSAHRWSDNTSERDTDTRCYHASNAVSCDPVILSISSRN